MSTILLSRSFKTQLTITQTKHCITETKCLLVMERRTTRVEATTWKELNTTVLNYLFEADDGKLTTVANLFALDLRNVGAKKIKFFYYFLFFGSDKGLTLEMSALQIRHGGKFLYVGKFSYVGKIPDDRESRFFSQTRRWNKKTRKKRCAMNLKLANIATLTASWMKANGEPRNLDESNVDSSTRCLLSFARPIENTSFILICELVIKPLMRLV